MFPLCVRINYTENRCRYVQRIMYSGYPFRSLLPHYNANWRQRFTSSSRKGITLMLYAASPDCRI